jgi:hypothetical protein
MREDEMEEEVVGSLPVRWKARSFCRRGFGDSEASGSLRIRQSPVSSCEKIEDSSEMDADRYADSLCTSLSIDEREGGGWEGGSEPPRRGFFSIITERGVRHGGAGCGAATCWELIEGPPHSATCAADRPRNLCP